MTDREADFHARVQAVLAEAAAIHRQRGEEYGELFAAPLAAAGWGSGDRRKTLEELIALKSARLRPASSPAKRRDTVLDLLAYQAMWLVLQEEEAAELAEVLERRSEEAAAAMAAERARRG